jgi:hypothetical protein
MARDFNAGGFKAFFIACHVLFILLDGFQINRSVSRKAECGSAP